MRSAYLLCYGEPENDDYAEIWKDRLDEALSLGVLIGVPFSIWFNHPETEEWMPCLVSWKA